jgi:predicted nucleic acid binding AN1-type Zn finger protein
MVDTNEQAKTSELKCLDEVINVSDNVDNKEFKFIEEKTIKTIGLIDTIEINRENTNIDNNKSLNKKKKNLKKRCNYDLCNKKIRMSGFNCKCGFRFCAKHRLDFEHNCTYDHKLDGKNQLTKQLIKIEPQKLEKI